MAQRSIVIITGASGSGKSYLARSLIGQVRRLVVADITGDYAGERCTSFADAGAAARWLAARAGGPFRLRLEADLERLALRTFRQAAAAARDEERPERLISIQAAAIALAVRRCVLVLDELAACCSPTDCHPTLKGLASLGRHLEVSYIGTTRRPAEVSRFLTAEASLWCCFQTSEPRDVEYLSTVLGREHALKLPKLPPRHFLTVWRDPAALARLGVRRLDARHAHRIDSGQ